MNERVYKSMEKGGVVSLTMGIIVTVTGIVAGILLIVHGAILLKNRKDIMI